MENLANTPLLPPDIMVEIFLLLPLDSLFTCKLVSKEWNRLVKHPTLTKLYNIKSTTFFVNGSRLNFLFRNDDDDSYKVRVLPLKLKNRYPEKHGYNHELLMESSKKIACVKAANSHFYLYSLISGDSHVVTNAPFQNDSFLYWDCYGFGYDCCEEDYKITVVCRVMDWQWFPLFNGPSTNVVAKINAPNNLICIYSFRSRGWKFLEGFPRASYMRNAEARAGYSFNGVLYWVLDKLGTTDFLRKAIVAFDVHSYRLAEIALPPADHILNAKVTDLDGHLCCSFERPSLPLFFHFDVWVMKEYGLPESWTKLFSICESRISSPLYQRKYSVGLDIWGGDERKIVVFLCHNSKLKLFRYDIDKDEMQVFSNGAKVGNDEVQELDLVLDHLQRWKLRFKCIGS